jgi:hypothetical protein
MSIESTRESDFADRKTGPTVSKDKWLNHARSKMARGYLLIVGNERKNANFYLQDKGYEMCPYQVAKGMIKAGLVEEAGEHYLGTLFKLRADAVTEDRTPARRIRDDDDIEPVEELESTDVVADVDDDIDADDDADGAEDEEEGVTDEDEEEDADDDEEDRF